MLIQNYLHRSYEKVRKRNSIINNSVGILPLLLYYIYVFVAFRKDGFESQNPSFQCFIAKTRKEGNYF